MCTDCNRLDFVEQRDGDAVPFAKQCIQQYRRACLAMEKGRRKFSREFRIKFAQGYIVSKRYVNQK